MTTHTPWGESQHSREYAPGIVFHSTASHGGFRVSHERVAAMPPTLRAIVPFAHNHRDPLNECARWYEEDQDWAIVALAFPEAFNAFDLLCARDTVFATWHGKESIPGAAEWLRSDPQGAKLREQILTWKNANGHLYRQGMACTGNKGWRVSATRIDDREEITIDFEDDTDTYRRFDPERGYYGLRSPFNEARVAELGGRIVKREPLPLKGA